MLSTDDVNTIAAFGVFVASAGGTLLVAGARWFGRMQKENQEQNRQHMEVISTNMAVVTADAVKQAFDISTTMYKDTIRQQSIQIESLKSNQTVHDQQITDYKRLVDETQQRVESIERDRADKAEAQEAKIAAIQQALANANTRIKTLTVQVDDRNIEAAQAQTELKALKALYDQVVAEKDNLTLKLTGEVTALEGRVAELEQKVTQFMNQIQQLTSENEQLKARVQQLEKEKADLTARNDELTLLLDKQAPPIPIPSDAPMLEKGADNVVQPLEK